jgi:hypothetical protein
VIRTPPKERPWLLGCGTPAASDMLMKSSSSRRFIRVR